MSAKGLELFLMTRTTDSNSAKMEEVVAKFWFLVFALGRSALL